MRRAIFSAARADRPVASVIEASGEIHNGIRGHDISGLHGVSSSFEFRTYLSTSVPLLYGVKTLSIEIDIRMLAIKALAVLALALVAIAPSPVGKENHCYGSGKEGCVERYAGGGRHPELL